MLYLAHCSFDAAGGEPTHGYFTYLTRARSLEDARERLRAEGLRARDESDVFDGAVTIYLDDIIEMKRLPRRGVIGRYQDYAGEAPSGISCSLPADDPAGMTVHDSRVDDPDGEDGAGVPVEAFVTFGPQGE